MIRLDLTYQEVRALPMSELRQAYREVLHAVTPRAKKEELYIAIVEAMRRRNLNGSNCTGVYH